MGKPSRERSLSDKEARAIAKNLRVSPQKLNLVAGMIRGKKVEQALADLEFSRKRIAQDVRKCVMSAVANAENNHNLRAEKLVVKEAVAGEGPTIKRFIPKARGSAGPIRKRTCHIFITVSDEIEIKQRASKAKGTKKSAAKKKTAKKAETSNE